MPGLGARIGRGGSTMFLQDLARSDCIVIMGANMAENHPVGFRFVMEARERGAEVIHVDPRFTRTSAAATRHVPVRAGSDLASSTMARNASCIRPRPWQPASSA